MKFQEQFLTSQQVCVLSPCYSMCCLWYAPGSLLETQILTSIQDLLDQNLHFNESLRSTTEDERVLNAGDASCPNYCLRRAAIWRPVETDVLKRAHSVRGGQW